MEVELEEKKSIIWISESLKDAVRKGEVILKENKDRKATCWTKFRLAETADGCAIFGWAVCIDCHYCVMFKSMSTEGTVTSYGTTNMTDHLQSCFASRGKQQTKNAFVKRTPGVNFLATERTTVKEAEDKLVVLGGTSFALVDNPALRSFAQELIQIGAKYGNVDADTVLYGRKTVTNEVFDKMKECQQKVKVQVLKSLKYNAVSFCTDDINKNSYILY